MGELTIRAGWVNQTAQAADKLNETGNGSGKKNYFAGDLRLAEDPVAQKRKEAQEKAWNVVQNAWDNDKSVDEMIESRKKHALDMEKRKEESLNALSEIENEKKVLQELYGVTEEEENLAELDKNSLAEYQERVQELDKRASKYQKDLREAERQRMDAESDIRSIVKERLKSNPMLEAQQQAEEIKDAANEQVIGMLVQEATEHIDEVMEEAEEKSEKAAEKQEEREENLEELKLQRAIQEAVVEGTKEAVERAEAQERRNEAQELADDMMDIAMQSNKKNAEVQESLDEIKYSMKVLEADLKGIKVDEEV